VAQSGFRFGFSGSPFAGVDEVVDAAVRAEQAGFDTFMLADLPGALSPLLALAAVARATTAIRLAPFVLNTGLWNPATVARELATLDRVSGGRVEIILGSGIPQPVLHGVIPPDRDARFERLRATVEALKAAFAAPGITPGFPGRPRLLVAGTGDRTQRLAAAEADGFIIAGVPPVPKVQLPPGQLVLPELTATEKFLDRLRRYAGDRAGQLEVGTSGSVTVTDDAQASAESLAAVHSYLTPEQVRSSPKILMGTTGEIAAQILDRRDRLGLSYYVLRGVAPEVLADVISQVRQAALARLHVSDNGVLPFIHRESLVSPL
jgi:probable F420-dependent oxidoreductase